MRLNPLQRRFCGAMILGFTFGLGTFLVIIGAFLTTTNPWLGASIAAAPFIFFLAGYESGQHSIKSGQRNSKQNPWSR